MAKKNTGMTVGDAKKKLEEIRMARKNTLASYLAEEKPITAKEWATQLMTIYGPECREEMIGKDKMPVTKVLAALNKDLTANGLASMTRTLFDEVYKDWDKKNPAKATPPAADPVDERNPPVADQPPVETPPADAPASGQDRDFTEEERNALAAFAAGLEGEDMKTAEEYMRLWKEDEKAACRFLLAARPDALEQ